MLETVTNAILECFARIVFVDIPALNFNDFIEGGIVKWGMQPYYVIFGNFTWGIILGFIGAALYANERSTATVMLYLLLVGVFFSIIFPMPVVYLFGLIFAFTLTYILYRAFVGH